MKNIYLFILLSIITVSSCKDEGITNDIASQNKAVIPFTGYWQRSFTAGPGNIQTASYFIYQDSIHYTLTGPIAQEDYVIIKDSYIEEDNRFIGHTESFQYYLIFVKNENADSITLYKQSIIDANAGLGISVPNDSTTQNYGWNVYYN